MFSRWKRRVISKLFDSKRILSLIEYIAKVLTFHKYRYKKSKLDGLSASNRGVQEPKFRANSSSNKYGSDKSMSTSLLGRDSDVISGHAWDGSSFRISPCVCSWCSCCCCCCCSCCPMGIDEYPGFASSGNKGVLRRNCLGGVVISVATVSMFVPEFILVELVAAVLMLLFFSSDNCKYSAVLSSRQWKKISRTQ